MSIKLSEIAEVVVVRSKRKVIGIECDICKKLVKPGSFRRRDCQYFRVLTGHHDWGNDSVDSMIYNDICPECIGKFVTTYLDEADGTEYIEVETKHVLETSYEYDD